jgi:hypothetical protein
LDLINSLAAWWFRKRLSDLHLFALNPVDTQEGQLSMLVERAKFTQFGKKYKFEQIKSINDFQQKVSLQNYPSLLPYIEQMMQGKPDILWVDKVKWFAKSSGTGSGKSKFIPVSEEGLELNHFQAGKDVIAYYLHNQPNSKLLKGKTLKLGGSKKLLKFDEAYVGDLSAIMIDNMPYWSNVITVPEKKTALLSDWEIKIDRILNEAFPAQLVGLAGVPSWMMMLLKEALRKSNKKNVLDIWPELEVFFHGGVSFLPYKKAYQELFPSKNFNYMEVYNASEGFFALQDQAGSDELLLLLNHGVFYEFIPMNTYNGLDSETIIPLRKVEKDVNYAMVISTNSGLWRYIIGDTVKFTSTRPYRIKITGRTKHFINVFGEEIIIENADKAIQNACKQTNSSVLDYTVAPIFMETDKKGAHEWLIEFEIEPADFEQFKKILDKELQNINSDYEAKRYLNMTLDFPLIHKARKGLFYDWLKQKDKLGGQHKVPRLSNSRKILEELLQLF